MKSNLTLPPSPDLAGLLRRLAKLLQTNIEELKTKNQIQTQVIARMKTRVTSFNYDKGNVSWGAHHVQEAVTRRAISDQHAFLENTIKTDMAYANALKALSAHANVSEDQANQWLMHFCTRFIKDYLDTFDDETAYRIIDIFQRDIDSVPAWMGMSVGLTGIWIEGDDLNVGNLCFRKPNERDVEVHSDTMFYGFVQLPNCFLEFNYKATQPIEAQNESQFYTTVLLLAGLGSVKAVTTRISNQSVIRGVGSSSHSALDGSAQFRFSICKADSEFLGQLFKNLRGPLTNNNPSDTLKAIKRAFSRYQAAVDRPQDYPSTIALAISSIEALFLRGAERSELANRLSNRVAVLFRTLGRNPIQTRNLVGRAYEIRSTFIHGDDAPSDRNADLQQVCEGVLDIARNSLLILFQVEPRVTKEDLISRLDNALLDEKASERLKELLEENPIQLPRLK